MGNPFAYIILPIDLIVYFEIILIINSHNQTLKVLTNIYWIVKEANFIGNKNNNYKVYRE